MQHIFSTFSIFNISTHLKETQQRGKSTYKLDVCREYRECTYPVLRVTVSCAHNASSFLDHLKDDAAMNIAHNVGIIWSHDSTVYSNSVSTFFHLITIMYKKHLTRNLMIVLEYKIILLVSKCDSEELKTARGF